MGIKNVFKWRVTANKYLYIVDEENKSPFIFDKKTGNRIYPDTAIDGTVTGTTVVSGVTLNEGAISENAANIKDANDYIEKYNQMVGLAHFDNDASKLTFLGYEYYFNLEGSECVEEAITPKCEGYEPIVNVSAYTSENEVEYSFYSERNESDKTVTYNFNLGIPKGEKGDKGDDGVGCKGDPGKDGLPAIIDNIGATIDLVNPNDEPRVVLVTSRTDDNRYDLIFNFEIPRGKDGKPGGPGGRGASGLGSKIGNIEASATTLPSGSEPYAYVEPSSITTTFNPETGLNETSFKIDFGLPQGLQGVQGNDGLNAQIRNVTASVEETLEPGNWVENPDTGKKEWVQNDASARVEVTPDGGGNVVDLHFYFKIPRGGSGTVFKVEPGSGLINETTINKKEPITSEGALAVALADYEPNGNSAVKCTESNPKLYPVELDKDGNLAVSVVDSPDEKVIQRPSTENGFYPVLASESTGNTEITGTSILSEGLKYNPAKLSVQEGNRTTASGNASHSEGNNTTASGNNSHTEGSNTTASGAFSHSEGRDTTAEGESSHAEGDITTANGDYSHAEGYDTTASNESSHAEGGVTFSGGASSHSEGLGTYANGDAAHAEGTFCASFGESSHAEGKGGYVVLTGCTFTLYRDLDYITWSGETKPNILDGDVLCCFKYDGSAQDDSYRLLTYAQVKNWNTNKIYFYKDNPFGIKELSKSNVTLLKRYGVSIGEASHSEGKNTTAMGIASHSEGNESMAYGECSHAEGYVSIASGEGSHSEGGGSVSTSAPITTSSSQIRGIVVRTELNGAIAKGNASHGEGVSFKQEVEVEYDSTNNQYHVINPDYNSLNFKDVLIKEGAYIYDITDGFQELKKYQITESKLLTQNSDNILRSEPRRISQGLNPYFKLNAYPGSDPLDDDNSWLAAPNSSFTGLLILGVAHGDMSHVEGRASRAYGVISHAEGDGTMAIGYDSHAEGRETTALGLTSHSEGYLSQTKGGFSHAEGYNTITYGYNSHSEGSKNIAYGDGSHAEGGGYIIPTCAFSWDDGSTILTMEVDNTDPDSVSFNDIIIGDILFDGKSHVKVTDIDYSGGTITIDTPFSEARNSFELKILKGVSSGEMSHAEGRRTRAIGVQSHSEGDSTIAEGESSHAEGYNSIASGKGSHAEGGGASVFGRPYEMTGSIADGNASHGEGLSFILEDIPITYEGDYHYSIDKNDIEDETVRERMFDVVRDILMCCLLIYDKSSKRKYLIVRDSDMAQPMEETSGGGGEKPLLRSPATLYADKITFTLDGASGNTGLVWDAAPEENFYGTIKSGVAYGSASHVENIGNWAYGEGSHAEGLFSVAQGDRSHAEGGDTKSIGIYSHSEGIGTTASGDISHAEGRDTIASGDCSHAEGRDTIASGNCSHAEGILTKTQNGGEHAEGRNNISHTETDGADNVVLSGTTISSIGIGDGTTRKNAFEVMLNGDIYITAGSSGNQNIDYNGNNIGTAKTLQELLGGGNTTQKKLTIKTSDKDVVDFQENVEGDNVSLSIDGGNGINVFSATTSGTKHLIIETKKEAVGSLLFSGLHAQYIDMGLCNKDRYTRIVASRSDNISKFTFIFELLGRENGSGHHYYAKYFFDCRSASPVLYCLDYHGSDQVLFHPLESISFTYQSVSFEYNGDNKQRAYVNIYRKKIVDYDILNDDIFIVNTLAENNPGSTDNRELVFGNTYLEGYSTQYWCEIPYNDYTWVAPDTLPSGKTVEDYDTNLAQTDIVQKQGTMTIAQKSQYNLDNLPTTQ